MRGSRFSFSVRHRDPDRAEQSSGQNIARTDLNKEAKNASVWGGGGSLPKSVQLGTSYHNYIVRNVWLSN